MILNTSLDILIRLRERERLAQMLKERRMSRQRCSAHTYGLLTKGSALLRQPDEAKRLWTEPTEER